MSTPWRRRATETEEERQRLQFRRSLQADPSPVSNDGQSYLEKLRTLFKATVSDAHSLRTKLDEIRKEFEPPLGWTLDLFTALIDLYGSPELRDIDEIDKLLAQMKALNIAPDNWLYARLVVAFRHANRLDRMVALQKEIETRGVPMSTQLLGSFFKSYGKCGSRDNLVAFWEKYKDNTAVVFNDFTYHLATEAFVLVKDVDHAEMTVKHMLDHIENPNKKRTKKTIALSLIMHMRSKNNDSKGIFALLVQCSELSIPLTADTFVDLICCLERVGNFHAIDDIANQLLQSGWPDDLTSDAYGDETVQRCVHRFVSDTRSLCGHKKGVLLVPILAAYGRAKKVDRLDQIFDFLLELNDPDFFTIDTYGQFLTPYMRDHNLVRLQQIEAKMRCENVPMDGIVLSSLISGYGQTQQKEDVFRLWREIQATNDSDMLARCTLPVFGCLARYFAAFNCHDEVLAVLEFMKLKRIQWDANFLSRLKRAYRSQNPSNEAGVNATQEHPYQDVTKARIFSLISMQNSATPEEQDEEEDSEGGLHQYLNGSAPALRSYHH